MTDKELELLEIIKQLVEANADLTNVLWELTKPSFHIEVKSPTPLGEKGSE